MSLKVPTENQKKYKLYLPLDFRSHTPFNTWLSAENHNLPRVLNPPLSAEIVTVRFWALQPPLSSWSSISYVIGTIHALLIDLHSIHHRRSQMLHIYAMLTGCTCVLGFPSVTMMIISQYISILHRIDTLLTIQIYIISA